MEMTGSQRIEASSERVWQALNDPEILKASIPGCERIEKLSDTEMAATVTLKVGPVKASFQGDVKLADLDPPNGSTITGEGRGGAAGFAKGAARVSLITEGSATVLSYSVKADVGGKLAQLGGRLIDSTARRLAAEFFDRFAQAMAELHGVVVLADDAGALRHEENPPGRAVIDVFRDLRRDLSGQIGANAGDQRGRDHRAGLQDVG